MFLFVSFGRTLRRCGPTPVALMYEAIKVADFATKLEAQTAGRRLEQEGIPFIVKSQDSLLAPDPVSATIYVAPDIAERARTVLGIDEVPN
jgi:hypothetical protein